MYYLQQLHVNTVPSRSPQSSPPSPSVQSTQCVRPTHYNVNYNVHYNVHSQPNMPRVEALVSNNVVKYLSTTYMQNVMLNKNVYSSTDSITRSLHILNHSSKYSTFIHHFRILVTVFVIFVVLIIVVVVTVVAAFPTFVIIAFLVLIVIFIVGLVIFVIVLSSA